MSLGLRILAYALFVVMCLMAVELVLQGMSYNLFALFILVTVPGIYSLSAPARQARVASIFLRINAAVTLAIFVYRLSFLLRRGIVFGPGDIPWLAALLLPPMLLLYVGWKQGRQQS